LFTDDGVSVAVEQKSTYLRESKVEYGFQLQINLLNLAATTLNAGSPPEVLVLTA